MRRTDCMCFGMKLSYSELKFCVLGKAVETQLCQAVNEGYLSFFHLKYPGCSVFWNIVESRECNNFIIKASNIW